MKRISSIILTCALLFICVTTSFGDVTTAKAASLTAGVVSELPVSVTEEEPSGLYSGVLNDISVPSITTDSEVNITAGVTSELYSNLVEAAYVSKNNVDVVASSYEESATTEPVNIIVGEINTEDNNTQVVENEEETTTEETTETVSIAEAGRTSTGAYIVSGRSFDTLEEWEFDLLCRLVTGEACGETDEAQIAVAQVVLNRIESSHFPNSLYDVIYQKNPVQFSPTVDGNINKTPDDRCRQNVKIALADVYYPKEMLFFTSVGYTPGFTDYTKIDDMYFSLCYK